MNTIYLDGVRKIRKKNIYNIYNVYNVSLKFQHCSFSSFILGDFPIYEEINSLRVLLFI